MNLNETINHLEWSFYNSTEFKGQRIVYDTFEKYINSLSNFELLIMLREFEDA